MDTSLAIRITIVLYIVLAVPLVAIILTWPSGSSSTKYLTVLIPSLVPLLAIYVLANDRREKLSESSSAVLFFKDDGFINAYPANSLYARAYSHALINLSPEDTAYSREDYENGDTLGLNLIERQIFTPIFRTFFHHWEVDNVEFTLPGATTSSVESSSREPFEEIPAQKILEKLTWNSLFKKSLMIHRLRLPKGTNFEAVQTYRGRKYTFSNLHYTLQIELTSTGFQLLSDFEGKRMITRETEVYAHSYRIDIAYTDTYFGALVSQSDKYSKVFQTIRHQLKKLEWASILAEHYDQRLRSAIGH